MRTLIPVLSLAVAAVLVGSAALLAPPETGDAPEGTASVFADLAPDDRTAFREEVRNYLLENPEVLIESMSVLEEREALAQAEADRALVASNAAALFDNPDSWVGGNPEGDITIVEFLDYRCGFCRRAHPDLTELVASDGNIRLVLKEYPILGPQSLAASRYALAVRSLYGDAAYKDIHDALITLRGEVTDASLARLADAFGHDAEAVFEAMSDPEIDRVIEANHALAQSLGITGTPTFVIGETMLRGYLPLEGMQDVVAEERSG